MWFSNIGNSMRKCKNLFKKVFKKQQYLKMVDEIFYHSPHIL